MRSLFLKEAALLYFEPSLHGLLRQLHAAEALPEGDTDVVVACSGLVEGEVAAALEHPLYDVRAATLKALLGRFGDGVAIPAWLAELLRSHLPRETHYKATQRALQLLALPVARERPHDPQPPSLVAGASSISAADASSAASGSSNAGDQQAWEEVHSLQRRLMEAQHPQVQERALRGLGAAMHTPISALSRISRASSSEAEPSMACLNISQKSGGAGHAALVPGLRTALGEFLETLKSFSAASLPSEMRLAAVAALQASACLTALPAPAAQQPSSLPPEPSGLEGAALDAWYVALHLMEDEDDEVREAAAAAAGEAMGAVAGVHCAGLHVEQIERQAFQFLARCCGHLPAFQRQLMRWVYRPEGRGALDREWQPGAVRKLFDKEIDNHHEEPLLAAQLAAWQLRSLCARLQGSALAHLKAALATWLRLVVQDLEETCGRLAEMHDRVSWPGGLTHHQDAFGPLSRMLLAPYAAAALFNDKSDGDGDWLQEAIQRCAQLLTRQPLQPLLGNTLYQVLTLLEVQCGKQLGSDAVRQELGDAMDPEFSVLFLLAPHVPDSDLQNGDPIDFLT